MDSDEIEDDPFEQESEEDFMDVHWDDRPVDHDGLHDLETLLSADSESTSDLFGDIQLVTQRPTVSQPQVSLQPTKKPAQPVTVDTSKYKQKLLDVILTAVHSGHADPVENAVQVLKEHCEHPIGVLQLLDFVPQKNPPINVPAAYSCHSPLMIACEKERADLVKLLLEKGASVAFRNKDKLNALHIACNKGNTEIVELLLTAARNQKRFSRRKHPNDLQWTINARNERGWTPLMFAIKGGHIDTVNKLIRTGKVNYQAKTRKECNVLHFASRGTSLQCFNAILAQFKNASELIVATDKKGWNILHHACASKSVEILEQLLSQLSEDNRTKLINQHSKAGYTPLLTACEYQNEAAIKLLISHGANASLCAKDDDEKGGEKSGLHVAAIHDAIDIAKLLLDKECLIDTQDSEGNSPLHVAYKKSSFEVIAILRQADDGKLERLENKAGVLASDIVPDDIIPPEIKKRGKEAIDLYKKALREGKKKIPRCSLLILGEQRVGKTSVYRLLVGLGFNREQNPTLGIENKAVDTVDMRFLDIESWVEKSDDVQKEQSKELFAEGVVAEVRDKFPPKRKDPKLFEPVSEEQLMREVEDIKVEIERKIKEITTPAVNVLESDFQSMLLSHATQVPSHAQQPHHANTEDRHIDSTATPPHEILNPKSAPIKEHSKTRTHFPEKTQAARPEPTRVDQPKKPPVRDTHQHTRSVSDQPAPPIPTTDPLPAVVQPIVNRKHRHSINERLKSNFPQAEEEPSLILNTLDFAGQPEYRPMHHCFITRRAMYLVVFNLQNMVKYLKNKDSKSGDDDVLNPLEEVRYWLHSIHAHIYPPDEDERGRDEKMSRVCLVGTHRAPKDQEQGSEITEDELNTVDELLREELLLDDRCVDHIHCMEGRKRIFVAVENSIDRKDAKDREESGAKLLQHKLKSISSHLIFLKEDYPIVWLQFESELMRQREYQKQRSLSMVVKLEELQRWAHQQGIATPEAQNLAFQFFHDTGKIVYLKQIPKLFLNDEERDQLADLVILDPAWLIKVIKVIFEMKQSFQGVPGRLVRDLNGSGIASSTLLKACWEKFTHKGPASFHQLCLMLQANCLIYPVESLPCPMRAETDPLPSSSHLPTTPTRSQTSPETDDSEKFFLVPCKLPEKTCEALKADCRLPWIRFYFDFQKFLPNEIYHRFICLMLAVSESNKSKKKKNTYFSTCCQFYNIDGCNWKIELEQSLHRLKVSVLAKEGDERPPSYYITKVHTEYLQKICQDSNLQGLEYYGGPLVKCDCGEEEIVEFVGYADGRTQKPRFELWCTSCPKKHDVDELLKPQISVPRTTEDSETGRNKQSRSVEEDFSTPPLAGAAQNSTLLPTNTSSSKDEALSSSTLTLKRLTIIKWKDAKGEDQKPLRILRTIGPKWREAGRILDIEAPLLESISMKHQKDPGECCCEVFSMWLEGGYSSDYPVSWAGLIEFLVDMESKHLADNLRKALQFLNIVY